MSGRPAISKRAMQQLSAPTFVKLRRLEEEYQKNSDDKYYVITAVSDDVVTAEALNNGAPVGTSVKESHSDVEELIGNCEPIDECKKVIVKNECEDLMEIHEDHLEIKKEPKVESEILSDASLVDRIQEQYVNAVLLRVIDTNTVNQKSTKSNKDMAEPGPNTKDDSSMRNFDFKKKKAWLMPPTNDPVAYFKYFIDDDYLNKIVTAINQDAFNKKDRKDLRKDFIFQRNWTDLSVPELKTFIGLLLHTGTAKLKYLGDYWRQHRLYKSCFPDYMTPQRFTAILHYLVFPDVRSVPKPFIVNHPMGDHLNKVMDNIYYPGRNLRLSFSKVDFDIPLQECKFPVKVIFLHEHNGPILNVIFDCRRSTAMDTIGVYGGSILLQLLEGKLNAGHSVYVDEVLSTTMLARQLLRSNTYCNGILNHTRVGLPAELFDAKLEKHETMLLFSDGLHLGKHELPEGPIFYVTTEFKKEAKNPASTLPEPLRTYNEMQSDPHLEIFKYWPCEMFKLPLHKRLFIYHLLAGIWNANKMCNMFSGTNYNFHTYRLMVIEHLLPPPSTPIPRTLKAHKLTKIPKISCRRVNSNIVNATARRDCKNCSTAHRRRNNTIYQCNGCDGYPALCIDCFFELHKVDIH